MMSPPLRRQGRVGRLVWNLISGGAAWPYRCLWREAAPDRIIELELLPGTGRGDIEQVQLLVALLGREIGQPVPVRSIQLLKAREVVGQPHPRPLQALGL